jgi:hypothetical protein
MHVVRKPTQIAALLNKCARTCTKQPLEAEGDGGSGGGGRALVRQAPRRQQHRRAAPSSNEAILQQMQAQSEQLALVQQQLTQMQMQMSHAERNIIDAIARDARLGPPPPQNMDDLVLLITTERGSKDSRIQSLASSNNELDRRLRCSICLDREINVIFRPCHHATMCDQCVTADQSWIRHHKKCPICRAVVSDVSPVYLH